MSAPRIFASVRATFALATLLLASSACTLALGDIDFDRQGSGGSASTSSSSSTSSTSSSSSSASSSSTGGGGSATSSSSSTSTSSSSSGATSCPDAACDPIATCSVASGRAVCTCPSGYDDVNGNGSKCTDWNECIGQNNGNDCGTMYPNTTCENTPGSYTCVCVAGYIEFPAGSEMCIPDPCTPNPCNGNGTCASTTGAAVCTCDVGFAGATCDQCVLLVDGAATGKGDGSTWANAFPTIQPALNAADALVKAGAPTCDVWVASGTYYLYVSNPVGDGILLKQNVGLYGGFAGTETTRGAANPATNVTTISGRKSATNTSSVEHVLEAADVTGVIVDGFTLRDGNADGSGGSVEDYVGGGLLLYAYHVDSSVTISRCAITANAATYGGGIGAQWGHPIVTVTDCTIEGNTASTSGGGMSCADTCTVTGTTFKANTAGTGGGLFVGSSNLVLTSDTFVDNVASASDGGGMMLQSHPAGVVLSDLFFSGNRAVGIGGGVSNLDHAVTFSDSVFVGNTSSAGGGIADNSNGSLTCLNSTITGNRGTSTGDGIYWQNAAPSLLNTIVWGNPSRFSATNEDLSPTTGYSTSHSDVGGYTGSDATTFSADPSFVSAPRFFDRTTVAASGTGSVIVASGVPYALNDILEIGEDGVGRGVISVVGSTVSFSPPLASAAAAGVQVRDWGAALGTLDLHLATGSVCINAGDATVAPPTDITGQARVGVPDIGAYEHP